MLPDGAKQVQEFLTRAGVNSVVRVLPESTATASEAAHALGVEIGRIGKSVAFGSAIGGVVGIVSGDCRVDVKALGKEADEPSLRKLDAVEVRDLTGYVIGGVSPFGLPPQIKVIVDSALLVKGWCYVAAGHPRAVVRVATEELVAISGALVGSITAS